MVSLKLDYIFQHMESLLNVALTFRATFNNTSEQGYAGRRQTKNNDIVELNCSLLSKVANQLMFESLRSMVIVWISQ